MTTLRWIKSDALCRLHDESLAIHGGSSGLRDAGFLESALMRAKNKYHYEACTDVCALAACYAYGLAKNHPFVDGNKRAAFLAAGLFLALNGYELAAPQAEAYQKMIALASGDLEEADFAQWLTKNVRPR